MTALAPATDKRKFDGSASLYEVLGVKPNARLETIRKAHRKAVKLYHPDVEKTGDIDKFRQVDLAYKVLRDPERRKRYDADGTIDEERIFSDAQKVAGNLAAMFTQLLSAGKLFDERVSAIDLMVKVCNENQGKISQDRQKAEQERAQLMALRKTISVKDARENVFERMIDERVQKIDRALADINEGDRIIALMLDELGQYESFARMAQATVRVMSFGNVNTSTTSTTGW